MDNKENCNEMDMEDNFQLIEINSNSRQFKELLNCDIVELTHVACFNFTKEQLKQLIIHSNMTDECFMHLYELDSFSELDDDTLEQCIIERAPAFDKFWFHPKIAKIIQEKGTELIPNILYQLDCDDTKKKFEIVANIMLKYDFFGKMPELEKEDPEFVSWWYGTETSSVSSDSEIEEN